MSMTKKQNVRHFSIRRRKKMKKIQTINKTKTNGRKNVPTKKNRFLSFSVEKRLFQNHSKTNNNQLKGLNSMIDNILHLIGLF